MPISPRCVRALQVGLILALAGSMLAAGPRLRGDARRERTQGTVQQESVGESSSSGSNSSTGGQTDFRPANRPASAIIQVAGKRYRVEATLFYNIPGNMPDPDITPTPPPSLTLNLTITSIDRRPSTPRLANIGATTVLINGQRVTFPMGITEFGRTFVRVQGTTGASINEPTTLPVTITIPDRGTLRRVTIPNVTIFTPVNM
jgi:hypothetical protein